MNTTNKALIVLLALQGLLAVIMLGRLDRPSLAEVEQLLPEFSGETVERIEVFRGTEGGEEERIENEPDLVLAKENGIWLVKSHYDYPADPNKVEEFFDKVERLASRGPIAEGEAREQQMLVADQKFQRKVRIHTSISPEPITIFIGSGAGGRKSAVRIRGVEGIHGIKGFGASSAQYAVSHWLQTRYFEIEQEEAVAMTVENAAGRFEFERNSSGGWELSENTPLPAEVATREDGTEMALNQRPIENALRAVSLIKFSEPADPRIPRGSPLATVTLKLVPGAMKPLEDGATREVEEHEITIGPEWNSLYIISRDRAPAVMIHFNHLAPVVNMTWQSLVQPVITEPLKPPPGLGLPGASGQPPAGHGQQMPGHGQQMPGHGQQPPGHGQPASPH